MTRPNRPARPGQPTAPRLGVQQLEDRLAPALAPTQVTVEALRPTVSEGDSETLVAVVRPSAPAAAQPQGTVKFFDNGTLLGVATLAVVNGRDVATFSTAGLAVGAHEITARYDGSDTFAGSAVPANAAAAVTVTPDTAPVVARPTATNIASTTATLGGDVTNDGGALVTKRGVLFSPTTANANPRIGGAGVVQVDDAATADGDFTVPVTGLTPGVAYSYVAFATNGVGTGYSAVGAFTALSPAALTITAPAVTYGDPGHITVALNGVPDGPVSLSVDGAAAVTQSSSGGSVTFSVPGLAAGSRALTVTTPARGGSAAGTATGALTVNKAALTVTPAAVSKVYGQTFTAFTGTVAGLKNGDVLTPVYRSPGADANTAVGAYAILITLGAPRVVANYAVTSNPGTLTVTPAPLTVTADAQTKVYGQTLTGFTGDVAGLVNGDHVTARFGSPGASATAAAGSYAITATFSDPGSVLGNYAVTQTPRTLTVSRALLTVTADGRVKVYGAALPALTVGYRGFVNGDTAASLTTAPTAATAATAQSHAGVYDVTVSGGAAANYDLQYAAGQLQVTRAPLTVTAENLSIVYGAALPTFTAQYAGFVNGDTAASLTTAPFFATPAVADSPVGTYAITPSDADSLDYDIAYRPGTLTVTPASLMIRANDQIKVYGAAVPALGVSYDGFVNGDTAASLTTPPAVQTAAAAGSGVGAYAVTAAGATAANYAITYAPGTLTVSPASLTITAQNATKTYGAALPTFTAQYSGFVNGDTAASLSSAPLLGSAATAASPAGEYAVTVTGAAASNYTIRTVPGELAVTPVPLTVTADDQSMNFGDALPTLTARYAGFVNGDTAAGLKVAPVVRTAATPTSPAGKYAVTVGGAASPNYVIKYVTGSLTVRDVLTRFDVSAPAGVIAGRAVIYTVTAKDPLGRTNTGFTGRLQLTSTDAGTGASVPATVDVVNGVGKFTAKLVTAGARTITAADAASGARGELTVTVSPAAGTRLAFGDAVLLAEAGQTLDPAPRVKVFDAFGNLATGSTATVTITATGPGALRAGSTVSARVRGGVATFSNLVFDVGGSYSLKAAAAGLAAVTSNTFVVDAPGLDTGVPDTAPPAQVTVGGLLFRTNDNTPFAVDGDVYSAAGDVLVGFPEGADGHFRPILKLSGGASADLNALTFSVSGALSAVIGGTEIPLLTGSHTVDVGELIGNGLAGLAGREFAVAGAKFTFTSLALADGEGGLPQVKLQGSLALPFGLTLAVAGDNYATIGTGGAALTGASAALSESFTVGGLTFDARQLTAAYTAANNVFTLAGASKVTLPGGIGAVDVNFGTAAAPGVVLTDGALTNLSATLDSNLTVGGVTFATQGLALAYAAGQFTVKGNATAAVAGLGNLSVTFGGAATQGLVITDGSLTSLTMAVTSDATVGGVTIGTKGLTLSYTPASQAFTLAGGAATVAVEGFGNLKATFGQGDKPGLVLTAGALTSLNLTVDSALTVAGVTVTGKNLLLTYTAADSTFTITGAASVAIKDLGSIDVTFGQGATPGLVVTAGKLVSLNMTANTTFTVAGATFTGKALNLTYTAATSAYTLTGTAGVAVKGLGDLSVTFGQGDTPGLVVTAGALTSLNLTVDSAFTVGSVTLTAKAMKLTYTAGTKTYTVSGGATLAVTGFNDLEVVFGQGTTPGLVITDGALKSLNMTVTTSFTAGAVTFAPTKLNLTYAPGTKAFTLAGDAALAVGGVVDLKATFGKDAKPGLVIVDGALKTLDMTVTGSFKVSGVTVTAKKLALTYATADGKFTMAGDAGVAVSGLGDLAVTFGGESKPGLVITAGALTSLNMTVSGAVTVAGVTLTPKKLELGYTAADSKFTMAGAATLAIKGMGDVTATFGTGTKPGLVVTAGALTSLDMTVDGKFTVSDVTVTAKELNLNYAPGQAGAAGVFAMTGAAAVAIKGLGDLNVKFGAGTTPGLVVTGGALTSLNMTVNGSVTVAGATLAAKDLVLKYTAGNATTNTPSVFSMAGVAELNIKGLGDVAVTFGQGTTPGLVVTGGALTSLNLTVTGTLTVSLVTVTAKTLNITYTPAADGKPGVFTMAGDAGVAIKGVGDVAVKFGAGGKPGLVVTDGALTSLNMTVTGKFTVSAVTVAAKDLVLSYTAANGATPSSFNMSGTASLDIKGIGDVSVTFAAEKGLVVADGKLASLDMTVTGKFTVSAVTVTATKLRLTYAADTSTFTMTGGASLAIKGMGDVNVTFGQTDKPGLAVVNGELRELALVVDGKFAVAKVEISAKDLKLNYVAATGSFSIAGGAALNVDGMADLSVTFGYKEEPGISIVGGELKSLNMTVDSAIKLGKVTIFTKGLQFTYDASKALYTLAGTAGVDVKDIAQLSVTFGGDNRKGLVIQDGKLTYLEVSVTSKFVIGSVTFGTNALGISYTPTSGKFTMFGGAFVDVKGVADLAVTFGDNNKPGIVVEDGELKSLDVAVTSSFRIGAVTVFTKDLRLQWAKATATFNMTGTAGVKLLGDVAQISVTFGYKAGPGLVVTNGELVSLDMTVNANFDVKAVTLYVKDLRFTYHAAGEKFTMTGNAGFKLAAVGDFDVTFGNGQTPGLTVVGGKLVGMALTVNSDLNIGLAKFKAKELAFIYSAEANTFAMSGDAALTVGPLAAIGVKMGTVAAPGLVLTDGKLTTLNVTVDAKFNLLAFTFETEKLVLTYADATKTFTMTGKASFAPIGLGKLTVDFGGNGTKGLVVTEGKLAALSMAVTADFSLAGFAFKTDNLRVVYANEQFNVYGAAELVIPLVKRVKLNFGEPPAANADTVAGPLTAAAVADAASKAGMVFKDGKLESLRVSQGLEFNLGSVGVSGSLDLNYRAATGTAPSQITVTGKATVTLGGASVGVDLGGAGTRGVVFEDGKLVTVEGKVTAGFSAGGFSLADVNGVGRYDPATKEFRLSGEIRVLTTLNDQLASASWVRTFLPSGPYKFFVHYDTEDAGDRYVYVSTTVVGVETGVKYNLTTKSATIGLGNPFTGGADSFTDIGGPVGKAWQATANTVADAYKTAAKGVTGAYNVTADALESGYNSAKSWVKGAASTVGSGISAAYNKLKFWDAPVTGGRVYYDADFAFDPLTDPFSVTGLAGEFLSPVPAGAAGGRMVAVGGTDTATGLPRTVVLTAPFDALQVSPLTTLITELMRRAGRDAEEANAYVNAAFGLDPDINHALSPSAQFAAGGDAAAAEAAGTGSQVLMLVHQVSHLLGGVPGAPAAADIGNHVFAAMADIIAEDAGYELNLADDDFAYELIARSAAAAGVTLDDDVAAGAADVLAAGQNYLEKVRVAGGAAYLTCVAKAQVVGLAGVSPQLALAAAGQADIDTVFANYSGAALSRKIGAARTGPVAAGPATVAIEQIVDEPVGAGHDATLTFKVYLTVPTALRVPVSVKYATSDLTATAGADYAAAAGTLTWRAGDRTPKTITVKVNPATVTGANQMFQVTLSDLTNAEFANPVGVGVITFVDFASVTTLTASPTRLAADTPLTLTATVSEQDADRGPADGLVRFFDGKTVLGTAPLVNGVATFAVTPETVGKHSFTAMYTGDPSGTGVRYLPSTSKAAAVTVTPGADAITFDPLPDMVYGDAPFILDAEAESGQDVTYRVVSGPAKVIDDQVTITGAGTVVIEATQPGDGAYSAAAPVRQSFTVAPAPLTVTVEDEFMVYGEAAPAFTAYLDGVVDGDEKALSDQVKFMAVPAKIGAGTYPLTVSGIANPNYVVTYVAGTLEVEKALLFVTAADKEKVYGAALPALTVSYDGFVNGDTAAGLTAQPTLTTDATAAKDVGSYEITAAGAASPNYEIVYEPGILDITPAKLTIKADNLTAVFGQELPDLTVHYNGFVNGDTLDSLDVLPDVDLTRNVVRAGTYPIVVQDAEAYNYDITFQFGRLTVTPA